MMEQCGTLLIAEHGCELSDCLHPWLIENGHQCLKVDNIKDVLMTLQTEKVNVLVMDVSLPESLGYDAISIIKGLYRRLPVIVTADENNPEQESRIRRKGIFYYHVKSFGVDELMLAISNALMRSYSGGKVDAFTRKT
ncbi:response regulator [Desulfobacca acetoxidans]|nr:response regulator [Desulfobacca acetoxidans]HAY21877.1 response regulator [Desulfobacterales bacterium]